MTEDGLPGAECASGCPPPRSIRGPPRTRSRWPQNWLRRRRGDGHRRAALPATKPDRGSRAAVRDPRALGALAVPADHRAGSGPPIRWSSSAGRSRWPSSSAPAWWSRIRRSSGSGRRPDRSARPVAESADANRRADRRREHVPGQGRRRPGEQLRPALGPGAGRATASSPSTCRTPRPRASMRWTWPSEWAPGSATSTWPTDPGRRGTSTWSRAAVTSRAPSCSPDWPAATSTARWWSRQPPGAASPAERESDLAEALTFARWHLDESSWTTPAES